MSEARAVAVESLEFRRLMAFGSADTSFGASGFARNNEDGSGISAAQLSDGRVAVLASANGSEIDVYTSGGQLDTGFSGDGKLALATNDAYYNVKAAANGKLLLFSASGITRYNTNGSVDTSFGTNGTLPITFGYQSETVASDGSIYLLGDAEITKYTDAGVLVTGFGSSGRIELSDGPTGAFTSADDNAMSLGIGVADGKLVVAGIENIVSASYIDEEASQLRYTTLSSSIFVKRFTLTGQADTSFGNNGAYLLPLATTTSNTGSVQILPQGDGSTLLAYSNSGRIQTVNVSSIGGGKGVLRTSGPRDGNVTGLFAVGGADVAIASTSVLRTNDGTANQLTRATRNDKLWTIGETATAGLGALKPVDVDSLGRIIAVGAQTASGTTHFDQVARIITDAAADPVQTATFANGQQSSIATDQAGNVYLAYYDAATKTLKFDMRDENGHWGAVETVDSTLNSGIYLSIDVGGNGPGIAYFDGTNGDLKYAQRSSNGTWTIGTVDSKGSVGLYPSLYLGGGIQPYISYYAKTTGDLRVAHLSSATDLNTWAVQTVDSDGDTGRSSSLSVDPYTQRYNVAYAGPGNTVKLAESKRNVWSTSVVAQTSGGVGAVSLGYERAPSSAYTFTPLAAVPTMIAYYDAGPADLVIARRAGGGTKFSTTTIDSRGATGLYPTFVQNNPAYGTNLIDTEAVIYWNRRTDQVLSGLDVSYNSKKVATAGATISSDVLATGGGRFLSAALSFDGTTKILGYQDTASGNLIVRFS